MAAVVEVIAGPHRMVSLMTDGRRRCRSYAECLGGNLDASVSAAAILVVAALGVLIAVRVFHWGRVLDVRSIG